MLPQFVDDAESALGSRRSTSMTSGRAVGDGCSQDLRAVRSTDIERFSNGFDDFETGYGVGLHLHFDSSFNSSLTLG